MLIDESPFQTVREPSSWNFESFPIQKMFADGTFIPKLNGNFYALFGLQKIQNRSILKEE